jgi:hypothetical protein
MNIILLFNNKLECKNNKIILYMKKINHFRIFLIALRTAIIVVSGFIAYEILLKMEKILNKMYPNIHFYFTKRKLLKLFLIFLIDLSMIYFAILVLKVKL